MCTLFLYLILSHCVSLFCYNTAKTCFPFCSLHFGHMVTFYPSSTNHFSELKPAIISMTLAKSMFNFSAKALWKTCQFSQISSLTFHLFKSWVAQTGFPDCGWSTFLPLSHDFLTQWHTVFTSTLSAPQKANNHWWISIGASSSRIKNSVKACCLMPINMAQNKSSILNQTECQPLCKPSLTTRQTEAKGTMK